MILYSVSVIISIVVIAVLYYILLQTRKKNELLESHNQLLKQDNQLITHQYERVIFELSTRMLQLTSIQNYLVDLKKDLKESSARIVNSSGLDVKSTFRDIETLINESSWEEFYERYDELHDNFMNKLMNICPGLTVAESRLCALIRLNLSSKEICILTNRSLRTVENLRFRIRKKLKIDKSVSLSQYILSI